MSKPDKNEIKIEPGTLLAIISAFLLIPLLLVHYGVNKPSIK